MDDQLLTQSPFPLSSWGVGSGVESSNAVVRSWASVDQLSSELCRSPARVISLEQNTFLLPRKLQGLQETCIRNQGKRPNIRIKYVPSILITQESTRFQELSSRNGDRDQYIYFFLFHKLGDKGEKLNITFPCCYINQQKFRIRIVGFALYLSLSAKRHHQSSVYLISSDSFPRFKVQMACGFWFRHHRYEKNV